MLKSPAGFQQRRRICISKKKQQHITVDTVSSITHTQPQQWTKSIQKKKKKLIYPPQAFILAESQTSVRKTSNVPKDPHTNFLKKQKDDL